MPKTHNVFDDVKEFCGWPKLMGIINRANKGEERALLAALFLTGGRISEVLRLTPANFDLSKKDIVVVKTMPVSKKFKKVGDRYEVIAGKRRKVGWVTEPVKDDRTIPIPRKEPPVPILLEWVARFKGEQRIFRMSRVQAFLEIRKLGPDLYCHWFRAQRASQLASEYDYDLHDLMDYFHWKDIKIAMHYSRLGYRGLARKMLVPESR